MASTGEPIPMLRRATSFASWMLMPQLLAMVLASAPAAAKEPSEIDKDAARTSLEQGDERMRAKDFAAALEAYRRADDIMGVPTTSIEVGRAALALGRLVLAHEAFKRAANFPKEKGEPPPFTTARDKARKQVRDLAPRIPHLLVEVDGPPTDVDIEVQIDDETIDAWGGELPVDPGLHNITASASGYEPTTREVVLQEGETRTLLLELIALNAPDVVDNSGLWWTIAAVSLPIGGASLIAGAVTGGLSLSDSAAVKDQCDGDRCPPEAADQLERSRTLAHVSTATLVVGGVGVALGAVALAIALTSSDDNPADEPAPAAILELSPVGFRVRATF